MHVNLPVFVKTRSAAEDPPKALPIIAVKVMACAALHGIVTHSKTLEDHHGARSLGARMERRELIRPSFCPEVQEQRIHQFGSNQVVHFKMPIKSIPFELLPGEESRSSSLLGQAAIGPRLLVGVLGEVFSISNTTGVLL